MKFAGIGAVLLCVFLSACRNEDARDWSGVDTVFLNVAVIDLEADTLTPDQMLVLSDGVIQSIEPAFPGSVPASIAVLDMDGRVVMPGLFDAHVHSFGPPLERVRADQGLFIASGVTHVREMGSGLANLQRANAEIGDGPGPVMIAAGALVDGQSSPWLENALLVVATPEEASEAVETLVEGGADFLKAYTDLSSDTYEALLAAATASGLPVDGHVPRTVGFPAVASGSQRTVEHLDLWALMACTPDGSDWAQRSINAKFGEGGWGAYFEVDAQFWDALDWDGCVRPGLDAMARRGAAYSPTLLMAMQARARIDEDALVYLSSSDWCQRNLAGIEAATPQQTSDHFEAMREAFTQLRASGVPLIAGTDSQNYCMVPGMSLAWELSTWEELGASAREALLAATLTPARVFGMDDRIGQIAPGMEAHLVFLEGDPRQSLDLIRNPVGVYTQGRWYDGQALADLRAEAVRVSGN